MKRIGNNTVLASLSAIALSLAATTASASPFLVSTPGIGTQALVPSADTLTLSLGSETVPLGVFGLQPANYFVGDSGYLSGTFPYTFNESVTIDGDTETVPITMQNLVTNPNQANTDFLTVFFGSSVFFSGPNVWLTILPYTSPAFFVGGGIDFQVPAELTADRVPEPGTLALIAAGLLSLLGLGMMRRRADA